MTRARWGAGFALAMLLSWIAIAGSAATPAALPDASPTLRGAVSTKAQVFSGTKTFDGGIVTLNMDAGVGLVITGMAGQTAPLMRLDATNGLASWSMRPDGELRYNSAPSGGIAYPLRFGCANASCAGLAIFGTTNSDFSSFASRAFAGLHYADGWMLESSASKVRIGGTSGIGAAKYTLSIDGTSTPLTLDGDGTVTGHSLTADAFVPNSGTVPAQGLYGTNTDVRISAQSVPIVSFSAGGGVAPLLNAGYAIYLNGGANAGIDWGASSTGMRLITEVADGASATGLLTNTISTWSNAGARLAKFQNNGVTKVEVDATGAVLLASTATASKGLKTLAAGTGTVTVLSGAVCVCSNTAALNAVRCSVSTTTLTITGTGTDTIAYICL